jgi:hypothetical protein
MKPYFTKILLLMATLVSSCEYEGLPTYSGQDQIYFAYADNVMTSVVDEQYLHFGYDEVMKQETILYVSVKVMGSLASVDRPVTAVLVDSLSTATLGRDVELLPALSVVPAGKPLGVVAIKIKNTTSLYDTVLVAALRLVENEYFHTDYTKTRYSSINSEGKIVSTAYRIWFDNDVDVPRLWAENLERCTMMFGEYSNVKFALMCRLLGFDKNYFSYSEGNSQSIFAARISPYALAWVRIVTRYLNEFREEKGYPLRDELGREVKMGVSSIS